ncbi:P-loop containing nucleoside triphosphate hydrolase protein, partial [Blyttiomyces helicus]
MRVGRLLISENRCSHFARGEAGSGKTELHRLAVRQLLHLSSEVREESSMQTKLLNAHVILEAFGNARTPESRNSSRFGCYTEVQFDEDGAIVGFKITPYCFEKTRVFDRAEGERTFHIFYRLISGMVWKEKAALKLGQGNGFKYLDLGKSGKDDWTEQAIELEQLRTAMRTLGFTRKVIGDIFTLIATILHLGNIEFAEDVNKKGDGAFIKDSDTLDFTADLLGVYPEKLEEILTTRTILVGDSLCSDLLDPARAREARDEMAATLYSILFSWIIEQIDERIGAEAATETTIGIVDFPGFIDRAPKTNGFEDFCFNYANERLQAFVAERLLQ